MRRGEVGGAEEVRKNPSKHMVLKEELQRKKIGNFFKLVDGNAQPIDSVQS